MAELGPEQALATSRTIYTESHQRGARLSPPVARGGWVIDTEPLAAALADPYQGGVAQNVPERLQADRTRLLGGSSNVLPTVVLDQAYWLGMQGAYVKNVVRKFGNVCNRLVVARQLESSVFETPDIYALIAMDALRFRALVPLVSDDNATMLGYSTDAAIDEMLVDPSINDDDWARLFDIAAVDPSARKEIIWEHIVKKASIVVSYQNIRKRKLRAQRRY